MLAALGVSMAERGARSDEYLDAMTALWTAARPAFHGRFVDFADVDALPRPTRLRIVVGGRSRGAYRRAVSRGHAFYGNGTPAELARDKEGLQRAAEEVRRPAHLGELEIMAMPLDPVDIATPQAYAALGVRRMLLRPPRLDDAAQLHRWLDDHAPSG